MLSWKTKVSEGRVYFFIWEIFFPGDEICILMRVNMFTSSEQPYFTLRITLREKKKVWKWENYLLGGYLRTHFGLDPGFFI